MSNKRVVRKLRPQVKYAVLVFIVFFIFYLLWTNFSGLILSKKAVSENTQLQKDYQKEYNESRGDNRKKAFVKMFASNFFTFRNKVRKGEIGGINFVDDSIKESFRTYVLSSYYQYFTEIKNEVGDAHMPNVEKVDIEAIRDVKYLPYTSRVNFDSSTSPSNVKAADITITYDSSTDNKQRYHKNATIYFIQKKGEYKVVKLVSE